MLEEVLRTGSLWEWLRMPKRPDYLNPVMSSLNRLPETQVHLIDWISNPYLFAHIWMLLGIRMYLFLRHWPGIGSCREGLPLHHRPAGEDERRESRRLARSRSWDRTHAHVRHLWLARESHLRRATAQQPNPQLHHLGSGAVSGLFFNLHNLNAFPHIGGAQVSYSNASRSHFDVFWSGDFCVF